MVSKGALAASLTPNGLANTTTRTRHSTHSSAQVIRHSLTQLNLGRDEADLPARLVSMSRSRR
jgi:hypothetical protein